MSKEVVDSQNDTLSVCPESIKSQKALTDLEAITAILAPETVFRGFRRARELDEHPMYGPRDNWERHWGKRTASFSGRTEVDGEQYATNVVIIEPNIAFRGIMHLLRQKVATAEIIRAANPTSRGSKSLEQFA